MGAPLRARLPLHTRFPLSPAQERKGQASAELRLPVWKGPGPAGAKSITSLNQSRPATRAWAARARPRDRPVLDRGRRLPLCRPPGGERGPAGGGGAGAAAAAGRALATGSGRPWRAPGAASLQPRPRPLTMAQHVFLTGPPGIGKTTLIQKATEALKSSGVPIDGFYTEEVREHGRRIGFDVVTLSGRRGTLSRLGSDSSTARPEYRVGQYIVDLVSFEHLVLPVLRNVDLGSDTGKKVYVIDEIGKMELFSRSFIQAVRQTLTGSGTTILGTIPIPKGKPLGLVEEIRSRKDVMMFNVTKENRDNILQDIVTTVQNCRK